MIGKSILHYKIIEKLGEGGMGIVYLAEDTKLERKVAIKFLPHHIAANSDERKRFEIEAKAAAALNHNNIATVHAIEKSGDEIFIVMEYIEGKELKNVVGAHHDAPLKLDNVLDIAIQIAEGLQAAHEKGIVHRDIKSSNIMVTDKGKIKIMDFGLAKFRDSAQLTQIGTTVGTAAYMSPEQTRGEDVDQRTDIWSFGVLLYEMLTGQLPFKGDYEQAVIYSIMNEEHKSLRELRNDISAQLEEIVSKALQKDPANRYQNAQQIIDDFNDITKPATTSQKSGKVRSNTISASRKGSTKLPYILAAVALFFIVILGYKFFGAEGEKIDTLAVLPFVNASSDQDTEYLSDGVTVSLINRLAEFSDLKVMSRHSVARFKDGKENPLTAGQMMDVKSVVTGRLDLWNEKLIVDVELLKVDDGQQLWGERYERDKKDILTIEHDIVNRIGEKLKVRLAKNKEQQQVDDTSIDPLAYDNYLRGRYIMLGTSDDGPARAQEYFRQAIEREPRLAIAHAGLGESYVTQAWLGSRNRDEVVPLAKAALNKAMELEPGLCEAHVLAGEIALYFDWDWSAAEINYRKAMELNPGSDLAHREYSSYLLLMDKPEEAIAEGRIAQSLDPLSVYATHQLGYNFLASGRFEEAVIEFRKALDLNPTWVWGNIKMGMAYALMGNKENASKAVQRADELLAGKEASPLAQDWLAQIAYMSGDENRIIETMTKLKKHAEVTYVDPFVFADMNFRIGNYDATFKYVEQAFEDKSPLMPYMLIERRVAWKRIKDDPRYMSLLKQLNFPNVKL